MKHVLLHISGSWPTTVRFLHSWAQKRPMRRDLWKETCVHEVSFPRRHSPEYCKETRNPICTARLHISLYSPIHTLSLFIHSSFFFVQIFGSISICLLPCIHFSFVFIIWKKITNRELCKKRPCIHVSFCLRIRVFFFQSTTFTFVFIIWKKITNREQCNKRPCIHVSFVCVYVSFFFNLQLSLSSS